MTVIPGAGLETEISASVVVMMAGIFKVNNSVSVVSVVV